MNILVDDYRLEVKNGRCFLSRGKTPNRIRISMPVESFKNIAKQFLLSEPSRMQVSRCEETAKIFTCEINGTGFPITVPMSELAEKAQEIWDHPNRFCNVEPGTSEAYYDFLKFLWVEYPDGSERRLVDIVVNHL